MNDRSVRHCFLAIPLAMLLLPAILDYRSLFLCLLGRQIFLSICNYRQWHCLPCFTFCASITRLPFRLFAHLLMLTAIIASQSITVTATSATIALFQ